MALTQFEKYKIGNVFVHDLCSQDIYDSVTYSKDMDEAVVCFSMNGEGIANYNAKAPFKNLIDQASLIHADGWSTMMAGRVFTKGNYVERLATTDCYKDIIRSAIDNKLSVFFLGASEEDITKTVQNVQNEFPDMELAGYRNGYFDDLTEVTTMINESGAQVIFVGLGRPKQETISLELRKLCPNLKYIKTCGGLFDFLSGKNSRAPQFVQDIGMEWAYRLFNEPKRLFYRYFWTNCYSIYLYIFKSG